MSAHAVEPSPDRTDGKRYRQARFAGRSVLFPTSDPPEFRIAAVLDWVELRISTSRPTQWPYIQKAALKVFGRTSYVESIGDLPSSCTLFSVRIQDPEGPLLVSFKKEICRKFGDSSTITVSGLELSLDFFPKTKDRDTLDQLLAHVRQHLFSNPDEITRNNRGSPRAVFGRGKGKARFLDNGDEPWEDVGEIYRDETLAFGCSNAGRSWRVYAKATDCRVGGYATELLPEHWSARAEVTLGENWLADAGISALDDLLGCQFERLKKHLRFMLPTGPSLDDSMSAIVQQARHWQSRQRRRLLETGGVWAVYFYERRVGRRQASLRPRIGRRGAGQNGCLIAYNEMNEWARTALRRLTRQFGHREVGR